jgi:two-component system, LytTR family, response regulator
MKNLRCLIIDDKPLAIDILADYAGKVPFLELITTTTNPIDGLNIVREQKIDLVFLDIQMPGLTGLQFMKITGRQCMVILTTAYTEYALDGFENDVIDYLLKPIAFDRFYRAAEKACRIFRQEDIQPAYSPGNETMPSQHAEFLFVKTEHRIQKINLKDILYVEAIQNYISINTTNGRVMSLQPLKKIEEQLPPAEFIRVHKSYIVSLRHIGYVERSRIFMDDAVIPVGDSYKDGFYRVIDKTS